MLYYMYKMARLPMAPAGAASQRLHMVMGNPWNPLAATALGRTLASAADLFEHLTRPYGKPEWGLNETVIDGVPVKVTPEPAVRRTYCHLLHFRRATERKDPRVLIIAPLSGHYATLLRGTVAAMLPDHDVYVTDWQDCRMIPVTEDRFNLNDYIDYLIDFLHLLGPNTHVIAVCQPAVPALAATAVM